MEKAKGNYRSYHFGFHKRCSLALLFLHFSILLIYTLTSPTLVLSDYKPNQKQNTLLSRLGQITLLVDSTSGDQHSGETVAEFTEWLSQSCMSLASDFKNETKRWKDFYSDPIRIPEPDSEKPSPLQLANQKFSSLKDQYVSLVDELEAMENPSEFSIPKSPSKVDIEEQKERIAQSKKEKDEAEKLLKQLQDTNSKAWSDLSSQIRNFSSQGLLWLYETGKSIDRTCTKAKAQARLASGNFEGEPAVGTIARPSTQGSSSGQNSTGATR